ncbi:carboxymuconolactone decarboxylase family protein [Flavihumibacter rivuli]|uniref:carboxymuconolactone decarboxylase family protein n=1 Tax=Flavihumibacter rivuli TaxID=2838156 RepID=UPI001BDE5306|nr:carboxymuconolactone decarboxylase family protein [Flavihumibacter rivuli]ULQ55658.1 carboxymuconolactone decarboxylase family protein [Flavihumibacter rivuli]
MDKRIKLDQVAPEIFGVMARMERYLEQSSLSPIHKDLLRIHASHINGCSFCLELHKGQARKLGETEERLDAIAFWPDSTLFSKEEKLILSLTESITLIHHTGEREELLKEARDVFGDQYLAQLIMAIITINAWNRLAISVHLEPLP